MKFENKQYLAIIIFSVALGLLASGCGKNSSKNGPSSETSKIETPNSTSAKIKAIKIGQAEDFSILAYASITSIPNSNIAGKVGIMPGTKEQITLESSEVAGGVQDILSSDDETLPMNLLSNAKVDMVTAYMAVANLDGDKDKIGIHNGVIDEKVLVPGVYQWNDSMTISKDFTLQGTETDIWIFKINGHLKVESGVRMILDGAKPENIMWQIAGSVVLESQSNFAGTVIAQPSIEMKRRSVLTGRAFCKNGYVNLYQATIKKP